MTEAQYQRFLIGVSAHGRLRYGDQASRLAMHFCRALKFSPEFKDLPLHDLIDDLSECADRYARENPAPVVHGDSLSDCLDIKDAGSQVVKTWPATKLPLLIGAVGEAAMLALESPYPLPDTGKPSMLLAGHVVSLHWHMSVTHGGGEYFLSGRKAAESISLAGVKISGGTADAGRKMLVSMGYIKVVSTGDPVKRLAWSYRWIGPTIEEARRGITPKL